MTSRARTKEEQEQFKREEAARVAKQFEEATPEELVAFERVEAIEARLDEITKEKNGGRAEAFDDWLQMRRRNAELAAENAALRAQLAQSDPATLAEFDAACAEKAAKAAAEQDEYDRLLHEAYGSGREPSLATWLEARANAALVTKIVALGVPGEVPEVRPGRPLKRTDHDAVLLAGLSPETRARLQLDGKPLP
jgi:hypothetical protein